MPPTVPSMAWPALVSTPPHALLPHPSPVVVHVLWLDVEVPPAVATLEVASLTATSTLDPVRWCGRAATSAAGVAVALARHL